MDQLVHSHAKLHEPMPLSSPRNEDESPAKQAIGYLSLTRQALVGITRQVVTSPIAEPGESNISICGLELDVRALQVVGVGLSGCRDESHVEAQTCSQVIEPANCFY